MRRIAPILLAAALGGCELTEVTISPSEDVLVVEAALRAGEPVQRILLHRSIDSDGGGADAASQVTVTTPAGQVVPFQHASLNTCTGGLTDGQADEGAALATCFVSATQASGWVQPGAAYDLSVRTPEGRVVRGRTTVPGDFRLVSPNPSTTSDFTCRIPPNTRLPLVWTVSDGAWAYLSVLVVEGLGTALAGTGVEAPDRLVFRGVDVSAGDTTRVVPADFIVTRLDLDNALLLAIRDGFPEGTSLEIGVAAIDRNYANAVRGGNFNPSGRLRISSVVGDGVGYFGSLVPLRLKVVVTSRDDGHPPCGAVG